MPEDINIILKKLDALEAKVNKAKETDKKASIWGWIVGIVLAAAISIGAGLLLRKLNKKNAELAKYRTRAEQEELKAKNAAYAAKVAASAEKENALKAKSNLLKARARKMFDKAREEQAKLDEAVERIVKVKTWKELDMLNDEGRG